ncbi:MAG: hypothetical protein K8W52_35425 [Deltaproteobacteria bacterium]|nr:hypothetical protein [Deltaproteobacteria bacterium]
MNAPRLIPGLAVSLILGATAAHAAPPTVDGLLCQRTHTVNDAPHAFLSVMPAAIVPTVTVAHAEGAEQGTVTVCQDAAKTACKSFTSGRFSYNNDLQLNADGTLILVGSDKGLVVERADTGKLVRTIKNRRGADYQCGGGLWLGTTVLARGGDCAEFDARPYLASGRTGAYIAPLVGKQFETTEETVYEVAPVAGTRWAIAVHDDNNGVDGGVGRVYVIDVKTGKVKATVSGAADGTARIVEGTQSRTLAKLPACKP